MFGKKKIEKIEEVSEVVDERLTDIVKDIIGGLKNAISRGESLDVAMQSFANAGYDVDNIMIAANYIVENISQQTQQVETPTQENISETNQIQTFGKSQKEKEFKDPNKKIMGLKPTIFFIILGISVVFLIGALLLGLNWGKIF